MARIPDPGRDDLSTYLDRIIASHRTLAARRTDSVAELIVGTRELEPGRGFRAALAQSSGLAVISEVKRRSPSKGILNAALDPEQLARVYADGGATCLSVLTDETYFGGSVNDLVRARAACALPVLRKDFTVCEHDVVDTRLMGADCVLLIAAALSPRELVRFHDLARQIGLDVLIEVHDEAELQIALDAGADLIGVNQRDLVTFEVDHERAVRMAGAIPADVVKVAESGVRSADDARALRAAGYDAILVGETLVTASDPASMLRSLAGL